MVGVINVIAWWVGTSSGAIYTAISAFGIFTFWYPDFAAERWQVYLCYLLVIILSSERTLPLKQHGIASRLTYYSAPRAIGPTQTY